MVVSTTGTGVAALVAATPLGRAGPAGRDTGADQCGDEHEGRLATYRGAGEHR